MLKRYIVATAFLAGPAVVACSGAVAPDIWKDPAVFYADNPVADPAPTPPDFKRAEIWNDPTVFYADNPYKENGKTAVGSGSAEERRAEAPSASGAN